MKLVWGVAGQRHIFFWLKLTLLLRRLLRSTRHAKKRHAVPLLIFAFV